MYEILNPHSDGDNIIVFFRNAYNGSIVAISKSSDRGYLEIPTNEAGMIDKIFILYRGTPEFFRLWDTPDFI